MSIFNLAADPAGSDRTAGIMCSRKACRADASWQLLWNNPKIHTPERRKVWLACSEHRGWLEDYLQTRGLWKQTLALDSGASDEPFPAISGQDH
ncbi:hypothetical protein V3C33_07995 [Micrococcaceae bacterium Sec5.7]